MNVSKSDSDSIKKQIKIDEQEIESFAQELNQLKPFKKVIGSIKYEKS